MINNIVSLNSKLKKNVEKCPHRKYIGGKCPTIPKTVMGKMSREKLPGIFQ